MRDLPVAFVICANPEPIGLAIKHRYGLESDGGDYEARRILEKFVDSYEDLSATASLRPLIQSMWKKDVLPWVIQLDEANVRPRFEDDALMNAAAFDAITTALPLFANIRVLWKSYEYVRSNDGMNADLIWTKWFLELASQIDPRFRRDLRTLASAIARIVSAAYASLHHVEYPVNREDGREKIKYATDKGNTGFLIFRSFCWDEAKRELQSLQSSRDPEAIGQALAFETLLAQPMRMDVIVT